MSEDKLNEDEVWEDYERLETRLDTTNNRLDTEEPLQQAKRPRNDLDRIGSLNSDGTANFLA